MHHLTWDSSHRAVAQALAAFSPDKQVIVGPQWVDIATPGEIGRQRRRGRIEALVTGIYRMRRKTPRFSDGDIRRSP